MTIELAAAFPAALAPVVNEVAPFFVSQYPPHPGDEVLVGGDGIVLPVRIYAQPTNGQLRLLDDERELVCRCLLARHHDGYVRQAQVAFLAAHLDRPMVVPFLMALVGEYVIEIHQAVVEALLPAIADSQAAAGATESVMQGNPDWWRRLGSRVTSYWSEYYRRDYPRESPARRIPESYPAAQILRAFAEQFDLPELSGPLRLPSLS